MRYRPLGKTGLQVSEISLGTVQLGLPYGLPDASGKLPSLSETEAMTIIHQALQAGINVLDTARSYGDSETIIGKALKKQSREVYVATKLDPLSEEMSDEELVKQIKDSIEGSRRALDRETIELMQVHNATVKLLKREALLDTLAYARGKEWIRFQGVTTYGVEAPQFALSQRYWHTVQVEFNLLNQSLLPIFEQAKEAQAGLIIRSAMLKGAIGSDSSTLPESLKALAEKTQGLPAYFDRKSLSVPQIALLFVLSHPQVATVLTGVIHPEQLQENLGALNTTLLSDAQLQVAKILDLGESALTDPRQWGF